MKSKEIAAKAGLSACRQNGVGSRTGCPPARHRTRLPLIASAGHLPPIAARNGIFAAGDRRAECARETVSVCRDRKTLRKNREKWPRKPLSFLRTSKRWFRRTGWWRTQSSETGLQRRNREFFEKFRPKQVSGRLIAASQSNFYRDSNQLHERLSTSLLLRRTGIVSA